MVSQPRGHHVLPHQDLRATHLPPDRREPLGGRPAQATRHRHPGAARPAPAVRTARRPPGLGRTPQPQRPPPDSACRGAAHFHHHPPCPPCPRLRAALSPEGGCLAVDVERAGFLTVLHRLSHPGRDRAADKGKAGYPIAGAGALRLHHLYRAMAWLGEELPHDQQAGRTPFAPRCIKDRIEEELFSHRRDLFTDLQLVFFDTTSIYFEGEGGQDIGQHGYSKDHRPDLYQMIVGAVLDGQGRPICCELWPGNTTDVNTLIPVVDRLRSRFGVRRVCIVADRGMISQETIAALEQDERGWQYILGARMRSQSEVKDEVLAR